MSGSTPARTTDAALPIRQPVRESLPQAVARQLLRMIDTGVLAPGQQLPSEPDLRTQFGVGRSTIREALNGLILIGAIEVRHGQGAFVLERQADSAARLAEAIRTSITTELLEAREAMELSIARLAAEHATEADLDALHELLAQAEEKVRAGETAVEEAASFHLLLAEASQNTLFAAFVESILGYLRERGDDLSTVAPYNRWEIDAHRDLLDAIASHDGARAQKAMADHLRDMRTILLDGWESFSSTRAGASSRGT